MHPAVHTRLPPVWLSFPIRILGLRVATENYASTEQVICQWKFTLEGWTNTKWEGKLSPCGEFKELGSPCFSGR